jgi:hypothetical protein
MKYSERLADRIRKLLSSERGVVEKKMFGGLAFMLRGNMCCGIVGRKLVARVGPERYESILARRHTRSMTFTGKLLKGFVYVEPAGCRSARDLRAWVQLAKEFALSLPAK